MSTVPAGYKQTEVGVIPEEWEVSSIKAIAAIKTGPFGTLLKASEYSSMQKGVPVISVGEIRQGYIRLADETPFVSEKVTKRLPQYVLTKGNIVFARKGGVDRSAVITEEESGWFLGSDGIALSFLGKIHSDFLGFQFGSSRVQQALLQRSTGTTMPSMNQEILGSVEVVLPPLPEQKRIAQVLTCVDALIQKLEALIAKKRDIKQASMQELLTGKRRLPGFSGPWETKKLGEIFDFFGGHTASREQLGSEGCCYLHYGDIHLSRKSYIDVKKEQGDIPKLPVHPSQVTQSCLLRDGDIVFVDASEDDEGTSKHVVIDNAMCLPFISGLHTIVARTRVESLMNSFKRYCFQSAEVKAQFRFYAVGTKVSGISKSNIAKIVLRFPREVSEQSAIGGILSDMDSELAQLESRLAKTRDMKAGLMQELLTGRIRLSTDN